MSARAKRLSTPARRRRARAAVTAAVAEVVAAETEYLAVNRDKTRGEDALALGIDRLEAAVAALVDACQLVAPVGEFAEIEAFLALPDEQSSRLYKSRPFPSSAETPDSQFRLSLLSEYHKLTR